MELTPPINPVPVPTVLLDPPTPQQLARQNLKLQAVMTMFVGFGFVIIILVAFGGPWLQKQRSMHATGTILALSQRHAQYKNGTHTYYSPMVSFKTPDGREFKFSGEESENAPYAIGAPIDVWYLPAHPDTSAQIPSTIPPIVGPLLAAIGLFLFLAGFVSYLIYRRPI